MKKVFLDTNVAKYFVETDMPIVTPKECLASL